jgi:hypothetical protein
MAPAGRREHRHRSLTVSALPQQVATCAYMQHTATRPGQGLCGWHLHAASKAVQHWTASAGSLHALCMLGRPYAGAARLLLPLLDA